MKALFLESCAAGQIAAYAQLMELDDGALADLLERAYQNGEKCPNDFRWAPAGLSYEDWWVRFCLKDDSHKLVDINQLMDWANTPEGHPFWRAINRLKPLAEKL